MHGLRERIRDVLRISWIVRDLHDLHVRSNNMKIDVVSIGKVSIFSLSSISLLSSFDFSVIVALLERRSFIMNY